MSHVKSILVDHLWIKSPENACGKQGHGVLNAVFLLQECGQECVCSSLVLQKRGRKINTSTN